VMRTILCSLRSSKGAMGKMVVTGLGMTTGMMPRDVLTMVTRYWWGLGLTHAFYGWRWGDN
jgi:hypothetical protein